jgi:hypothetical protein
MVLGEVDSTKPKELINFDLAMDLKIHLNLETKPFEEGIILLSRVFTMS